MEENNKSKKLKDDDFFYNHHLDVKNINFILNEYCFAEIFEYLNVEDIKNCEKVCHKWLYYTKYLWINYNNMKIFIDQIILIDNNKKKNTISFAINNTNNLNIIIYLFNKCGQYLNDINIQIISKSILSVVLNEIQKKCINVKFLKIIGYNAFKNFFIDKNLSYIFKNNKNLCELEISNLKLTGKASLFRYIDCLKLNNLSLMDCSFKNTNHFYDFISKIKNIKSFKCHILDIETNKLIETLITSNCISIEEFDINLNINSDLSLLINLLGKQKNLKTLICQNLMCLYDNVKNANSLKRFFDNIQEKNINLNKLIMDISYLYTNEIFLKFNNNLTILKMWIFNLTDNIIENIIQCQNLKVLKLNNSYNYELTIRGEKLFSRLNNLEKLKLQITNNNIDNILNALNCCKNLKKLNIRCCKFTKTNLITISMLKSLTTLKIPKINESYENNFLILINNLIYLKKLEIFFHFKLSFNVILKIDDIKLIRKDNFKLEILLNPCEFNVENVRFQKLKSVIVNSY